MATSAATTESGQAVARNTTRFVVLAEARSGSGWLMSLLDSHPACICYDELFHPEAVNGGKRPLEVSPADRDRDPQTFLERLMSEALADPGVTHAGFKHMLDVDLKVLRPMLARDDCRAVILSRRDRLAQYASLKVAQTSGIWAHFPHFELPPPPPIVFETRDFLDFCKTRDKQIADARRILAELGCPVLETTYERLADGRCLPQVLAHLALPTHRDLKSDHLRQDARPAHARFQNAGKARRLGRLIAWPPTRRLVRVVRGIRPLRPLLD